MKNQPGKRWSTIIIDDEPPALEILKALLKDYCPVLQLVGEAGSKEEAVKLIRKLQPDLVIMDIDLGDSTAFDILDQLSLKDTKLIFTTAHDEFAAKAFRYAAIDYLLKPVDPMLLVEAVERVTDMYLNINATERLNHLQQIIQDKKITKITLVNQEGYMFVELAKIAHIESDGNYCTVHLADGKKIVITRLISEFERSLPEDMFFRIHQRHIVNINAVEMIVREDGGQLLLKNGTKVPVARRRKEALLQWIGVN